MNVNVGPQHTPQRYTAPSFAEQKAEVMAERIRANCFNPPGRVEQLLADPAGLALVASGIGADAAQLREVLIAHKTTADAEKAAKERAAREQQASAAGAVLAERAAGRA